MAFSLPPGFLDGPAPNLKKKRIDFTKTPIPEYDGLYGIVLEDVLSREECDDLIKGAEAMCGGVWEQAMVNIGNGEQRLYTDVRDCGRIIWDSQDLIMKIWARCKPHMNEIEFLHDMPKVTGYGPFKRKETWQMTRPNERMRILKYGEGQYFRPHCDGAYTTPNNEEVSFYTLHLYLNESRPDSPEGPLEGGATTFHADDMDRSFDVVPKAGRVLIFQHKGLLHSGADVTSGVKITLRTDLMYKKISGEPKEPKEPKRQWIFINP